MAINSSSNTNIRVKVPNNIRIVIFLIQTLLFMETQSYCSSYCSGTGCTSPNYDQCTSCVVPFEINSPNCEIVAGSAFKVTIDSNAGSGFSVSHFQNSVGCNSQTYTIYGWANADQAISIKYIGVAEPHFKVYFVGGLILTGRWNTDETVKVQLDNTLVTYQNSYPFNSYDDSTYNQCTANQTDYFFRISPEFVSNLTSTKLQFNISMTNSCGDPTACQFGLIDFLVYVQLCHQNCTQCYGQLVSQCYSCISGMFYLQAQTKCYQVCPNKYYADSATFICQPCNSMCELCQNSADNCSQCVQSGTYESFLISDALECVVAEQCPNGTYPSTSTHVCQQCDGALNCETCDNVSRCLTCPTDRYLLQSRQCVLDCPQSYYNDQTTRTCIGCANQCVQCTNATYCTSCVTNGTYQSYLNMDSYECVDANACPSPTYPQALAHICEACNSSCASCQGNKDNCTSCAAGGHYFNNVCYVECPDGLYEDSLNWLCGECDPECSLCQTSPSNCSSCTTNGTYQSFLDGSSCVDAASCPTQTYPQVLTHVCQPCNSSCAQCQGNKDNCTSCAAGGYYLNNICYVNCPSGLYEDSINWQCTSCDQQCQLCESSPSNCSSCTTNGTYQSFLDGSSCVDAASCPAQTYPQVLTHVCQPCNSSCAQCQGNKDNCTSCISGLYYLSDICYSNCPDGYFQATSGLCQPCDNHCLLCQNSGTNCSDCVKSGTYQSFLDTPLFKCVSATSCTDGTYGQVSSHKCTDCDSSTCARCQSTAINCTQCVASLYLLSNNCLVQCPVEYYQYVGSNSGQCKPCNNYCYQCTGSLISQCDSCQTSGTYKSYYLVANTTCYVNCPVGYFKEQSTLTCDSCDSSCIQCTGNPFPCSVCIANYSYYPVNQSCLDQCPQAWYSQTVVNQSYYDCQPCAFQCLECYGPLNTNCTVCEYDIGHKLSGNTCAPTCLSGYGQTDVWDICVKCNNRCTQCYNDKHNCTSCYTSGGRQGFMIITDFVHDTGRCYGNCPAGYYQNHTSQFCDLCDTVCSTCNILANNCTSCPIGTYYLDFVCYIQCPQGYFEDGNNCTECSNLCLQCQSNSSANCTECNPDVPAFYYELSCVEECPRGYYQSPQMNYTCQQCNESCARCDGNPGPCYRCNVDYYLFEKLCYEECPEQQYFQDISTRKCLLCQTWCVKLDLQMKFQTVLEQAIIVTLTFSQDLDFTTFPYESFQSFSLDDSFFTLDMFVFEYSILEQNQYQIKIYPRQYIFMYNLRITVTLMSMPGVNFQSSNQRPFSQSVYQQQASLKWSLILSPDLGPSEKQVLETITNFTSSLDDFTSQPVLQQVLKSGVFAWLLPGVQITSCMVLVNGIMPRHLYQGIRIFAVFVFYQVPSWEKDASNQRTIFNIPIKDIIQKVTDQVSSSSHRRLLTEIEPEWRFKRTGWSMFFLLDSYTPILFIIVAWIVLLIFKKCIYRKDPYNKNIGRAYTFLHKVHEISILYLTITTILQWTYFDYYAQEYPTLQCFSLIFCIIMLIYFLCYQLYMYHDLFLFPLAHANTRSYIQFANKYGCFLSKIRHVEYDEPVNSRWSPKVWIRPYNYHILAYYKKFLMMICLPLFHQYNYAQIGTLIALQTLEAVRFCLTWPYASKMRNIYKLVMEIALLIAFIGVMIEEYLSYQLMKNQNIQLYATYFNKIGWVVLAIIILYNLVILVVMFIDLWKDCWAGGNISVMDQTRKDYYWEKVINYEEQNEDIHKKVVEDWIKKGNLNQRQNFHEDSRILTAKIQHIVLTKNLDLYEMNFTQAPDVRIKKQGFIKQQNSRRLKIRQKVHRFIQLTEKYQSKLIKIFDQLQKIYQFDKKFKEAEEQQYIHPNDKFKSKNKRQIIYQTFIRINLNEYVDGGRVIFYKNMTTHTITLMLNSQVVEKIKINQNIPELPLDIKKTLYNSDDNQNRRTQQTSQRYQEHNLRKSQASRGLKRY